MAIEPGKCQLCCVRMNPLYHLAHQADFDSSQLGGGYYEGQQSL